MNAHCLFISLSMGSAQFSMTTSTGSGRRLEFADRRESAIMGESSGRESDQTDATNPEVYRRRKIYFHKKNPVLDEVYLLQ